MYGLRWLLGFVVLVANAWGCTTASLPYLNTRRPVELARVTSAEAREDVYRLDLGLDPRDIRLEVETAETVEQPDLGVTLEEIDKELAQRKMLDPYRGLFVKAVRAKGPADAAGVLPGDVLLRMNGVELRYQEQFEHVVKTRIGVERPLKFALLRGHDHRQEMVQEVLPEHRSVRVASTRTVALVPPQQGGPDHAGILFGTLAAEWTERIYGENRPALLVAGVYVGSPAYLAGIRTGDRIVSVAGRHFDDADALQHELQERGARGEEIEVEVYRHEGGPFRTRLALERFDRATDIMVPLVFRFEMDVNQTRWSAGPLGIVAHYEGEYRRSDTRAPGYERSFCCLLGLFSHRWRADWSSTRLLWLIRFGRD